MTVLIIWISLGTGFADQKQPIPRTILAFYDSQESPNIRMTRIHRMAEMPLNHLGLKLRFADIRDELPAIDDLSDVRGVLTWFESDRMPAPIKFIKWSEQVINQGIQWVILGNLGIARDMQRKDTPLSLINHYIGQLGLQTQENWKQVTYDVQLIHKDPRLVEFERPYSGTLPSFPQMWRASGHISTYLAAAWGKNQQSQSDLVVIGSHGGYVAPGYSHYENGDFQQWYINPFEFFRLAFKTDDLPKPDTTTLSGRRIYYSHIDGDGWRNITEIEKYKKNGTLSAEVIFKEVFNGFPDLPVTLAPIAADLDPEWYGTKNSISLARQMFALPNVEAGSHTYSHPFSWKYFQNYQAENEWREFIQHRKKIDEKIVKRYEPFLSRSKTELVPTSDKSSKNERKSIQEVYEIPRAYLDYPFDLNKEIKGSVEFINQLLPPGKKVTVLQWSGDTSPFPAAIEAAGKVHISNINGGDSRFDPEFPSHTWVAPIGLQLGEQLQIYASASNENTYTDLWEGRYYGFKNLILTLQNTESPRRLKPFNIYYHLYSGEKEASLNALLENLQFARQQEITPVTTSDYAKIAEGFYSTQFIPLGSQTWRIENRGALQTIRFDEAAHLAVDMDKSQGVMGQRYYQKNLYVSLDAAKKTAVIALTNNPSGAPFPSASKPYLVQGRWQISNLQFLRDDRIVFTAQGFGNGDMVWKVPRPGQYDIQFTDEAGIKHTVKASTDENGILAFHLQPLAINKIMISLTRVNEIL